MFTNRSYLKGLINLQESILNFDIKLSSKTLLNYLFAYFKIPFFVPLPVSAQIEPSLCCNLRCQMCNIKNVIQGGTGTMSSPQFSKIYIEMKPMKLINFTGIGESLLNTRLFDFIKKAKEKNNQIVFFTNGQLLTKAKAKKVINSGVDKILISIESGEDKIYQKIRRGGKLSILISNVKTFQKLYIKTSKKIEIIFNIVLLKENLEDLNNIYKIIDLAAKLNIGRICFQNPHNINLLFSKKPNKSIWNQYYKKIKKINDYAEYKNIKIDLPNLSFKKGSCYYPWVYPQITAKGELLPCCIISQFGDYAQIVKQYSFGNVYKAGFVESWNSFKAVEFRKSLRSKTPNNFCQNCSKYWGIL